MQNSPTVKDDLGRYIDAGYPILYIHTFDESKADEYIISVAGRRDIFEWNKLYLTPLTEIVPEPMYWKEQAEPQ